MLFLLFNFYNKKGKTVFNALTPFVHLKITNIYIQISSMLTTLLTITFRIYVRIYKPFYIDVVFYNKNKFKNSF